MKQGLESVEKLVERANVLASLKRDYVADVRKTHMFYEDNEFGLCIQDEANYQINDVVEVYDLRVVLEVQQLCPPDPLEFLSLPILHLMFRR